MFKVVKKQMATGVLAAFILLTGCIGIVPAKGYAAVPAASAIGVVDYRYVLNQLPETKTANETLRGETAAAKKEFDDKSASLGDKEKQDLNFQLMQKVEQKRVELLKTITDKINLTVKNVAEAKGLSIVVSKDSTVYGGVDITEDVMKKIR